MCINILTYKGKNVTSHTWAIARQGNLILPCPQNLSQVENLPHALPYEAKMHIVSMPC